MGGQDKYLCFGGNDIFDEERHPDNISWDQPKYVNINLQI